MSRGSGRSRPIAAHQPANAGRAGVGHGTRGDPRRASGVLAGAACALAAWGLAACAGAEPPQEVARPELSAPAAGLEPFPPEGPVALDYRPESEDGVPYTVVFTYEGEHQRRPPSGRGREQTLSESGGLQIDYHAQVRQGASEATRTLVLVLDALRFLSYTSPPGREREVELADDRLRTLSDGEVVMDLRGAQPREDLTPRSLLGRPFAMLQVDRSGELGAFMVRGTPPARRFLRPFPLAEVLRYARLAWPEEEVAPGASWTAERVPANPAAHLGLAVEIRYQLAGFEEVGGVPCAWILVGAELDETGVRSASGIVFDRAVASVKGEAWVEAGTSRVRRLVIEDDVRVAFERGSSPEAIEERLRYRSRTILERRDPPGDPPRWADGTERFSGR